MAAALNRLLAIPCEGGQLAATLHPAAGATGVLVVTGGVQTRWGAHRGLRTLAERLAAAGHPCLRFDRRGVGDSDGDDPGFRNSLPDIVAARDALRAAGATRIVGWGLCDGAAALAMHARALGLDGLILANPWTFDADQLDQWPPQAAIAARYRDRLRDPAAWVRLVTGGVNLRKLVRGLASLTHAAPLGATTQTLVDGLAGAGPALVLLSERDATAQVFRALWDRGVFRTTQARVETIAGAGHTFARADDFAAMADACLRFLAEIETRIRPL